jgi:hypothetical protein
MRTDDCAYTISEERLREYAKVPYVERLRWLDELVRFTLMWRAAPVVGAPKRQRDGNDVTVAFTFHFMMMP